MTSKILLGAAALILAGSSWAQSAAPASAPKDPLATPKLDRREANQAKRIEQGKASGQLTAKEATELERRQDKLLADEQKAKADGKLTPQERHRLQREADRNSRKIAKEKHDKQKVAP